MHHFTIEQYLLNKNESATVLKSKKKGLNKAYSRCNSENAKTKDQIVFMEKSPGFRLRITAVPPPNNYRNVFSV
jgi:hypothetical protein